MANAWRVLPTFYPCIGYSDEPLVYFEARGLTYSGHNMDEDEFLEILRVPFADAKTMMGLSGINASAAAAAKAAHPASIRTPSIGTPGRH